MVNSARKNIATDHLKRELRLRTMHNQYKIDRIKSTIESFLKLNYRDEFNTLNDVIPKLNRFLIYCQQNQQHLKQLICSDEILSMDLTNHLKNITIHIPPPREMTIRENFKYRKLVDDQSNSKSKGDAIYVLDGDEIVFIDDLDDVRDKETIEKLLYKPFHDHNISS